MVVVVVVVVVGGDDAGRQPRVDAIRCKDGLVKHSEARVLSGDVWRMYKMLAGGKGHGRARCAGVCTQKALHARPVPTHFGNPPEQTQVTSLQPHGPIVRSNQRKKGGKGGGGGGGGSGAQRQRACAFMACVFALGGEWDCPQQSEGIDREIAREGRGRAGESRVAEGKMRCAERVAVQVQDMDRCGKVEALLGPTDDPTEERAGDWRLQDDVTWHE